MSIREKYGRYSLFVLIVGLGVTIFVEILPFLGGLLGAVTIYVLLRRQMRCSSAFFISSSRKSGWAMDMSLSALCQVFIPARFTAPYSVTM